MNNHRMLRMSRFLSGAAAAIAISSLLGCAVAGPVADELNPYGEGNSVEQKGTRDLSALGGVGGSKDAATARQALEVMTSYRRAQAPQPYHPVVQPAEVRLMWVPDHLNKHGDLVPAHYYYLRVMNWRWGVQDAFELDQQLKDNQGINYGGGGTSGSSAGGPATTYGSSGAAGSTPWVYKE